MPFKDRAIQILLIGLGIILLFYLISWVMPGFSQGLRNSALIIFRYPLNVLSRVYIGATNLGDFFKVASIKEENFNLKEDNLKLIQENEKLQEENILAQKFQELTNFFPTLETIPAESRGYFEEGGRSYFLVNKGINDGVALDKAVVWGKYLVGKITSVNPRESVVETILSKNLIINVCVASNRASGLGVAKGSIGAGMQVEGFPANVPVKDGDLVLTSGLGGILPPNLIVGKVLEKTSSQSEASQKFLVESLLDFHNLEFMQIVKN